jgi:nitroreductase
VGSRDAEEENPRRYPMDVYEAIEKRRSVRKFKGPVTEEQLGRILQAGALAPSPWNHQEWDVVVVDDPALIGKIAEIRYKHHLALTNEASAGIMERAKIQKEAFQSATLLMIYQSVGNSRIEEEFNAAGAWLLVENICLAAMAEGLATRIVSFWAGKEGEVDKLLHMPAGKRQVTAINVGIPDEVPPPRALKPREKWVHRNTFGS